MEFNWFDVVTAALILVIGIKGIFNGFVRELSGLLGMVAGIWMASLFAERFGKWLGDHIVPIDSASALDLIGFLSILSATWLVFIVIGIAITKFLSLDTHTVFDRLLGFLFSAAKVFVILAVIVFALSQIEIVKKNTAPYLKTSRLYPWFVKAGETMIHLEPRGGVKKTEIMKKEAENFIKKDEDKIRIEKMDKQSKKGAQ